MKIMVCYDDSYASEKAIKHAMDHASEYGADIYLVTSMVGGSEESADDIKKAEDALSQFQSQFEAKNIACETHLLIRGLSSGEDLVQFAEENGIDQIYIGIEKRSKVGKLLFGSTAQYVILEASCPVLTIK